METRLSRHSEAHDKFQTGDLVFLLGPSKDYAIGIGIIKKRLTGQEVFDILGHQVYYEMALLKERVYNVVLASGIECLMFETSMKHADPTGENLCSKK